MTAPARRGLLVLAYHAISPSWRHPLSTTPEAFRSQLALLAAHGWEVGSHSRTHRLLSELPPAEAAEELAGSLEEVRGHVGRCDASSYPWGEVVPAVVEVARRAGYSTGSGLGGRFGFGDPMRVPRVAIADADGTGLRFRLKISPLFWRARATPPWALVERARPASRPAENAAQSSAKV